MVEMASVKKQAVTKNEEELEERMIKYYQGLLNRKKKLNKNFEEFEKDPEKCVEQQNNTSLASTRYNSTLTF